MPENDKTEEVMGSGKSVKDFSSFCEGDLEPTLNKKIKTIIEYS